MVTLALPANEPRCPQQGVHVCRPDAPSSLLQVGEFVAKRHERA
jgi:hypothetical protein